MQPPAGSAAAALSSAYVPAAPSRQPTSSVTTARRRTGGGGGGYSSGDGGSGGAAPASDMALPRRRSRASLDNMYGGEGGRRRGSGYMPVASRPSSLFRSEEMRLVRMYFERAAAHDTVEELGYLGLVQFKDLNETQSAFSRSFSDSIKRCENMQRVMRFLRDQIGATDGVSVAASPDGGREEEGGRRGAGGAFYASDVAGVSTASLDVLAGGGGGGGGGQLSRSGSASSFSGLPNNLSAAAIALLRLDDLDTHLTCLEGSLQESNAHWDALREQRSQLIEVKHVLARAADVFHTSSQLAASASGGTRDSSSLLSILSPLTESPIQLAGGSGGSGRGAPEERIGLLSADSLEGGGGAAHTEIPMGDGRGGGVSGASADWFASSSGGSKGMGGGGMWGGGEVEAASSSMLSFFTGTLPRESGFPFERVLFRATRGNCVVKLTPIEEPLVDEAGNAMEKSVFVVFFSGAEVRSKVARICDAFGANRYALPEGLVAQREASAGFAARLRDLETVLATSHADRVATLTAAAASLPQWTSRVRREKAILLTLNSFNYDTSSKLFIAEGWCPASALHDVRRALSVGRRRSGAQVPSVVEEHEPAAGEWPPTHFRVNKFTAIFQSIVEAYGVAEYQEVNPAPYAVVMFPFLFAVMFGDVGHGLLMTLAALYLVRNEVRYGGTRTSLNEFLRAAFDGRYILLLMGLFSIYTGAIYNELFALPVDLFGSRWMFTTKSKMACGLDNCLDEAAVLPPLAPYPFGFDPVWKGSGTGLAFFNSYKMKFAIIIGVTQMLFGIMLSYRNAAYFRNRVNVLFEFIPQFLFMSCLFGYLVLLILIKWSTDYNAPACVSDPNCVPPDLKSTLIGIFMAPRVVPANAVLYKGQAVVQQVLLFIALVSVPWMLLPKPLILRSRHLAARRASRRFGYPSAGAGPGVEDDVEGGNVSSSGGLSRANGVSVGSSGGLTNGDGGGGGGGGGSNSGSGGGGSGGGSANAVEAFDFGEVFVGQMIHTIEFVLGAVSNTASYLRLWALSLAHAQLSDVFLEKVLYAGVATGNPFAIAVSFLVWAACTVGVLMCMEGLSAFLHALRLVWVEFMSKFYSMRHVDATKFVPFSFSALAEAEEEAEAAAAAAK